MYYYAKEPYVGVELVLKKSRMLFDVQDMRYTMPKNHTQMGRG